MSGENTVSSDEKARDLGAGYRMASVGPSPIISESEGRIVVDWPDGRGWSCEVSSYLIEEWVGEMNDLRAARDRARSTAVALEQELARKDQALDEMRALAQVAASMSLERKCAGGRWQDCVACRFEMFRSEAQRILSDLAAALDAHLNKEN